MDQKIIIKKIKKRRRFFAFCFFLFICFLICFFAFQKKDYFITYQIQDFQVEERYYKEKNYYDFLISKNDQVYFTVQLNRYFSSKKIIYDIQEFTTDTETCIQLSSNKIRFLPLCRKNNEQISVHLVSEEMLEKLNYQVPSFGETVSIDAYNIHVSNYLYHDFYIWNYHGFYHLSNNGTEEISLFQKDIYSPSLITQVDRFLFIPDYDANYYFEKVYLLDMATGNIETWKLSEQIYFDSIVLGIYEDDLYLVDKHEKKEWKINVSSKKLEQVGSESQGGVTYQNEFVNVTMNRLLYQDSSFQGVFPITYLVENGLYYIYNDLKIKLLEEPPSHLITYNEDWIYYLKDDSLYAYSLEYGEILLMKYFEWNFNYSNVIFLYHK